MRNIISIVCTVSAIWIVGCAAFEAAQDKQFMTTHSPTHKLIG